MDEKNINSDTGNQEKTAKEITASDLLKRVKTGIEQNTVQEEFRLKQPPVVKTLPAQSGSPLKTPEKPPDEEIDVDSLMKKYLSEEDYIKFGKAREQTPILPPDDTESVGQDIDPEFSALFESGASATLLPQTGDSSPKNISREPVPVREVSLDKFHQTLENEKKKKIERSIKDAEEFASTMPSAPVGDLPSEEEKPSGYVDEFNETDVKLMMAFGMEDELAQTVGFDKVSEIEADLEKTTETYIGERAETPQKPAFEFTAVSQAKEIFKRYKAAYRGILLRFLICVVLFVVSFFFENIGVFGGALPAALDAQIYPVVHIMVDLQILLLTCALVYRKIYDGFRALLHWQPIPESVMTVLFGMAFLYHIILCFTGVDASIALYNFPVVLCVMITILYEYMNVRREIYSFNIASSKRVKYAMMKLSEEDASLEAEAFGSSLADQNAIFRIGKTQFVDGFFKRTNSYAPSKKILTLLIPAFAGVSLLFLFFGALYTQNFFEGISAAYLALVMTAPVSVLLAFSYPFYRASREAYGTESAIIGDASLEEYSKTASISFDDRDVFPSYGVKVKSIKVYGSSRIDHVIYTAASLFLTTGGPLADVFEVATRDLGHSDEVVVMAIDTNGIEAAVEGVHVFCGKNAYIRGNGFIPLSDPEDAEIETDGETSILYLVEDNEITAKMYIQYVIDPDFELVLKQLHKIGVCVGIKTFDPNIDDEMLSMRIKLSKYPVKVLKCRDTADSIDTVERIESGVISKNSTKALLQTLSLCDKVVHVTKSNLFIDIFSMLLSVVITALILLISHAAHIHSIYVVLYQLFWMIPMIIMTRLYIGKL